MKRRRASVLLVSALLLLNACHRRTDREIAERATAALHAQMNAGHYDVIYVQAAPEFREAYTAEASRAQFRLLRKMYGSARDSTVTLTSVARSGPSALVDLYCNTKYDRGDLVEHFEWSIDREDAALVNYRFYKSFNAAGGALPNSPAGPD